MSVDAVTTVPQPPVPTPGTGSVEWAVPNPAPSSVLAEKTAEGPTNANKQVLNVDGALDTEVAKAIQTIDLMMEVRERSVQFERDQAAGKDVIKIVDDETGEVIRQMPPEELLSFMRNLTKMLGNFLDERI
jgi:flagellar protein FlaG